MLATGKKQLLRSVMSIEDLQPTEPVKPIYLNIKDQQVYFSKGVGEEELITPTTTTATASLQPRPQSFTQLLQSVIDDWDVRVHRFSTTRDAKHCLQAQLEIDRRLSIQRQSDDSNPQGTFPTFNILPINQNNSFPAAGYISRDCQSVIKCK